MTDISIIYPVTRDAIKIQDNSLNDEQCDLVIEYLEKIANIEIGVSWMEISKAISICQKEWSADQEKKD